jgi:hypothetical protein
MSIFRKSEFHFGIKHYKLSRRDMYIAALLSARSHTNNICHHSSHRLRGDLDNGGASKDGVVGGSSVAAGKHDVTLASEALGDDDLVAAVDSLGLNEGGASHGDEGSVHLTLDLVARGAEQDGRAGLDGHVLAGSRQAGESLDGQSRVGRGAALDEASGEGVDLVVREGSVEGLGEGALLVLVADVGTVAGLDGQDGASGCEVGLGHDVGSGTEVGADTNALKDGGGGEEGLHAGDTEGVGALSNGLCASSGQSSREELDVLGLIRANGRNAGADTSAEASSCEVSLGEVGETLLVEVVLKVLKGESVVENLSIGRASGTLGGSGRGNSSQGSDGECGLHCDG